MNIKIHYEGITAQDAPHWPSALKAQVAKQLQPLLNKHGAEGSVLHATLVKVKRHGKGFVARLYMHLPGKKIITASGEGPEADVASEVGIGRLFREAKKHFALLRGQDQFKRKARRDRLHVLKEQIATLPQAVSTQAQQSIERLLQRLQGVARRELAYLRAVGDLPSDYPTEQDLVDEAAAATQAAWKPGADQDTVYRQLLKNLFRAIDREVAASRQYGQAISLDAPVAPDAQDDVEAMVEEELYEYYQPDDTLSVADVLPAQQQEGAEGEEAVTEAIRAERASEQAYEVDLLKHLPMAWRRAVLLAELEAMALSAIADVLEANEPTVATWLDQARAFVAARLEDAGLGQSGDTNAPQLRVLLHTSVIGETA